MTKGAALQNRSYIYDCALAIIAFAASGNFVAAARIIKQLDEILDNPGYLAAIIFENGEDGESASRWTKSNSADSVTDVNDPTRAALRRRSGGRFPRHRRKRYLHLLRQRLPGHHRYAGPVRAQGSGGGHVQFRHRRHDGSRQSHQRAGNLGGGCAGSAGGDGHHHRCRTGQRSLPFPPHQPG